MFAVEEQMRETYLHVQGTVWSMGCACTAAGHSSTATPLLHCEMTSMHHHTCSLRIKIGFRVH